MKRIQVPVDNGAGCNKGCLVSFAVVASLLAAQALDVLWLAVFLWLVVLTISLIGGRRRRQKAKLERERVGLEEERWRTTFTQTEDIVHRALHSATGAEDPLWLSALVTMEERLYDLPQEVESGVLSRADATRKLLALKEQAEVLSTPPSRNGNQPSSYDILGVNPNASQAEIRKVYLEKMRRLHPDHMYSWVDSDRLDNIPPEVVRFLQDTAAGVNKAYGVLGNVSRRREYDKAMGR